MTPRHLPLLLAASILALGAVACAPKNPEAEATPIAETTAPEAPQTAMPESGVTSFVEKAARADMFEIEASKIILERSKVQPVKDFANMMIEAHTGTSAELALLAKTAGVMAPTELDADHLKKLEDLRTAKDQDVDDVYIDQQTAVHNGAVDLMKDYANNGKDTGLQAFAAKVALVVDKHRLAVKALDKSPADDVTKPKN